MNLVLQVAQLVNMCWIPFNEDGNETGVEYLIDLTLLTVFLYPGYLYCISLIDFLDLWGQLTESAIQWWLSIEWNFYVVLQSLTLWYNHDLSTELNFHIVLHIILPCLNLKYCCIETKYWEVSHVLVQLLACILHCRVPGYADCHWQWDGENIWLISRDAT